MIGKVERTSGQLDRRTVYEWFTQLHGTDRLIFLTDLIQFCLPLELRFLVTCATNLAQQESFLCDQLAQKCSLTCDMVMHLLDQLSTNTDPIDLSGLLSTTCCSKMLSSLLLLSAEETQHAHVFYRFLMRCPISRDDEELVMLLVMAQRHPAFSSHMRHTLKMKTMEVFPELKHKDRVSNQQVGISSGTEMGSQCCHEQTEVKQIVACNYQFVEALNSHNPFTMETDSVQIYVYWKNGLVTVIRRGINDLKQFKNVLDANYGSQVIPDFVIEPDSARNVNKLLHCLNEFLNNLIALPSNISNGSVVYEFLLAVDPGLITDDSLCVTFTSSDGVRCRFPKHALVANETRGSNGAFSKQQCCQLERERDDIDTSRTTRNEHGVRNACSSLAKDFVTAINFMLQHPSLIALHKLDMLFSEPSPMHTTELDNAGIPPKLKPKLLWSIDVIRKWHVSLVAGGVPKPPEGDTLQTSLAPLNPLITDVSSSSFRGLSVPPYGLPNWPMQQQANPSPMCTPSPAIVLLQQPALHFHPAYNTHNPYPPNSADQLCPGIAYNSNHLVNQLVPSQVDNDPECARVFRVPVQQQPISIYGADSAIAGVDNGVNHYYAGNLVTYNGCRRLRHLDELFRIVVNDQQPQCCNCGRRGHHAHNCTEDSVAASV